MTSTTWAIPRYVQELTTILGPQNRTQGSCALDAPGCEGGGVGAHGAAGRDAPGCVPRPARAVEQVRDAEAGQQRGGLRRGLVADPDTRVHLAAGALYNTQYTQKQSSLELQTRVPKDFRITSKPPTRALS